MDSTTIVDPRVAAQETADRNEFRSFVQRLEGEAAVVERLHPNIFGQNLKQLVDVSLGQEVNKGVPWRLSAFHQLKNMFEIMTKNLNDIFGEDPKVSYNRKLRDKVDYILNNYDDYYCAHHFVEIKELIFGLVKSSSISQNQLIKLLYNTWMVLELTANILVQHPVTPHVAHVNRSVGQYHSKGPAEAKVARSKAKTTDDGKPTAAGAKHNKAEVHKDRVMVQENGHTVFRKVKPNAEAQSGSQTKGDNYKTKMCHYMQTKGHCTRGNSCTFAHDESELRAPAEGNKAEAAVEEPAVVVSVASSSSNSGPQVPAAAETKPTVVETKAAPTMAAVLAASAATPTPAVRQPIPVATPQPAVQFITAAAKQAASAKQ